jgi:hypothetical protein
MAPGREAVHLVVLVVPAAALLVVAGEEVAVAPPVEVRTDVQQPLNRDWHDICFFGIVQNTTYI